MENKAGNKAEIYLTKCVQHLTFLDYSGPVTMERAMKQACVVNKDKQIQAFLRERQKKLPPLFITPFITK
jgi:hypothetical protein